MTLRPPHEYDGTAPTRSGERKVWAFYITLAWATAMLWLGWLDKEHMAQVLMALIAGFFMGNVGEHVAGIWRDRYGSSNYPNRHDP